MGQTTRINQKNDLNKTVELNFLLERIFSKFGELEYSQNDIYSLKNDIEDLPKQIKVLSDELDKRNEICWELKSKLVKDDLKNEFYSQLKGSSLLHKKTRKGIFESKVCVNNTKAIIERLFKMSSLRDSLPSVKDEKCRKAMGKALTATAITIEKIIQGNKNLDDALYALMKLGLDDAINLNNYQRGDPSVDSTVDSTNAGEKSSDFSDSVQGGSNNLAKKNEIDDLIDDITDSSNNKKLETKKGLENCKLNYGNEISEVEILKIFSELNEWSKKKPFILSELGNRIQIISSKKDSVLRIRASALWGERKKIEKTEPYSGKNICTKKIPNLWSLPIVPPSSFANYKECYKVNGEESISECEECRKSNSSSCDKCKNKKILHYYVCENIYTRTRIEKTVLPSEFPETLLSDSYGKILLQMNQSAIKRNSIEPGLEKKCIEEIEKKVNPKVMHKVIQPFYNSNDLIEENNVNNITNDEKPRLVRTIIEILEIPVIQLKCKFKVPLKAKYDKKFKIIIYDHEKKYYFDEIPKLWTRKATSWIACMVVVGIPIGFLIEKIIRVFV